MENICTNIIHITYYCSNDEAEENAIKIMRILESKFKNLEIEYNDYGIITDVKFESTWSAPLSLLDEISETFKVDIIGVSFEFKDGYVEAFELFAKIDDEGPGNIVTMVADNSIKEGIDTIQLSENETDILSPSIEEDVIFSDKEQFEWKEKELEDWQKDIISENIKQTREIKNIRKLLNSETNPIILALLKEQLDAMCNYQIVLNKRIELFYE